METAGDGWRCDRWTDLPVVSVMPSCTLGCSRSHWRIREVFDRELRESIPESFRALRSTVPKEDVAVIDLPKHDGGQQWCINDVA